MEHFWFEILSTIIEARKALTANQLGARLVGYPLGKVVMAVAEMERLGYMTTQMDGRDHIYGLTRKGLEAQQNYLYASKDATDTAGIE